jgi:DNA ligase (NAD+)
MKDRINNLRATIDHHNRQYYELADPEISDAIFDKMFQKLTELENEYPEYYNPDSPTSRVGSDLANSFKTVSHLSPMLSVNSVQTATQIEEFIAGFDTVAQLKYDGVGVNLIYKDGKLFKAVTRGDGYKGVDMTANIRTFSRIPYTVSTLETIEIRGEVYCPYSELKRLQSIGENVKSPVAVAINTIKIKQSGRCAKRNLSFVAYHLTDCIAGSKHSDNIEWLKNNHFDTPVTFDIASIKRIIASDPNWSSGQVASMKDIPADGIVFKHNDLLICKAEGHTSRNVNWAISWKFDKEIHQGTIAGIGGHVAWNGRVDHTLFINPIVINNEVICKMPFPAFFPNMDISIGQTIAIRRVGTRVARIVGFTDGETQSELLTHCPQCSAPLVRRGNQFYCSSNCQDTNAPPESEALIQSINISVAGFSIDPAMFRYIVNKNDCRLFRLTPKSDSYLLYYNNTKQLADIGHQVGAYVKQF